MRSAVDVDFSCNVGCFLGCQEYDRVRNSCVSLGRPIGIPSTILSASSFEGDFQISVLIEGLGANAVDRKFLRRDLGKILRECQHCCLKMQNSARASRIRRLFSGYGGQVYDSAFPLTHDLHAFLRTQEQPRNLFTSKDFFISASIFHRYSCLWEIHGVIDQQYNASVFFA